MKKIFLKYTSLFLFLTVSIGGAFSTREAKALVSIPTAAVAPAVLGAGLFIYGGAYFTLDMIQYTRETSEPGSEAGIIPGIALIFRDIPLLILGGLILDQSSENYIQFKSISAVKAKQMGLTKEQWTAYESELTELNAVSESVSQIITINASISAQEAANVWNTEMSLLSPHTQVALKKMIQSYQPN